jgi:hypothetical protein
MGTNRRGRSGAGALGAVVIALSAAALALAPTRADAHNGGTALVVHHNPGPGGGGCWTSGGHGETVFGYPYGMTAPVNSNVGQSCPLKDVKVEAWVWGVGYTSTTWGPNCTGVSCTTYAVNPNQGWFSIQSWQAGCYTTTGQWCTGYVRYH